MPLVRHWCVKSTKPVAHHWRASRYVYVDRFLCTFLYISWLKVTFNMYPNFDINNMFYAGCPWWVYCLAAYSLSCRGRFADTGIIWNMLLIIYAFNYVSLCLEKSFCNLHIALTYMLLYVGNYCDSVAWRAPKWGCCQPTSSPHPGMYVLLSLVVHHFPSR